MKLSKFWKEIRFPLTVGTAPMIAFAAMAHAAEPQPALPATESLAHELSLAEAQKSFKNLAIVKVGSDPNSRVFISGMVSNHCVDKFEFANTQSDPGVQQDGKVGFVIRDLGGGVSCMQRHIKDNCNNPITPCTRLSEVQGTSFDLSTVGHDAEIQLMHTDKNLDMDQMQWEGFSNPLSYKTASTIRAEKRAAAAARKERKIDRLVSEVTRCRKSLDELVIAEDALGSLRTMVDSLSDEVASRLDKYEKDLVQARYNILAKQWIALKNTDEGGIEESLEALKAFEAEHPEFADKIAVLIYERANAIAKMERLGDERYTRAQALITEAQDLSGLNDAATDRLAGYQRDLQGMQLQTLAKQGVLDPYGYRSYMMDLRGQMAGCTGPNMRTSSCQTTMKSYKSAINLPQIAQRSAYEQYVFDYQMQMQMSQMGMGPAGYMPGPIF